MPSEEPRPSVDVNQPLLAGEARDEAEDYFSIGGVVATPVQTERATFTRNLGTSEVFAIVIGIVIGSGVFTSPGAIDTNVPSPGIALVIWLVGGVLAWTGASTFAELGTAIPGEGESTIAMTSFYLCVVFLKRTFADSRLSCCA